MTNMTDNFLFNSEFESWGRIQGRQFRYTPSDPFEETHYDNIIVPYGFNAYYREGFPLPADPLLLTGRPEMKIFDAVIDPLRVVYGLRSFQQFTFWRGHDMGWLQFVTVPLGVPLRLSAYVHAWYSECDEHPHSLPHDKDCQPAPWAHCYLWLGVAEGMVGPYSKSVQWSEPYEQYGLYAETPFVSPIITSTTGTITVLARSATTHSLKHADVYYDGLSLSPIGQAPGLPRIPYDRTAHVPPQSVTRERFLEICGIAFDDGLQTVSPSADDAMLHPPGIGSTTAVVYDVPVAWRQAWNNFRDEYYPNTKLIFRGTGSPPPPAYSTTTTLPPPPLGDYPSLYPATARGHWGVHGLAPFAGYLEFVASVRPPGTKFVSDMSALTAAHDHYPDGHLTFRFWAPDQNAYRLADDKDAAAMAWWTRSGHIPDLVNEIRRKGLEKTPIFVEIMNEIYSHNYTDNLHSIAFERAAVRALAQLSYQYNVNLRAIAFAAAVGNCQVPTEPGGEEIWSELLPLARLIEDNGGGFGYHAYYGLNYDHPEYVTVLAPWLQDRWQAFDAYLTAHGVYIPWFLGEAGGCEAWLSPISGTFLANYHAAAKKTDKNARFHSGMRPVPLPQNDPALASLIEAAKADVANSKIKKSLLASDSWAISFNPMGGWRAHITKERYADELMYIDTAWRNYNRANNWRLVEADIFQSGALDSAWQWFALEGDDLTYVGSRIIAGYD